MTSTSTFQGLEDKPNSRVLRPPGGSSSNIFGAPEDVLSSKPHRMASNIFGPPEETSLLPKRSNPPGGKSSGIFSESDPLSSQPHPVPAVGKNSDIFGEPVTSTVVRTHPNKPKDADLFSGDTNEELKAAEHGEQESEERKEESQAHVKEKPKEPTVDDHEPHLGPRPRSHNKVTQPPGGRSTLSLF
ncbi:jupiter microtubule associated homolog 2 isoform X2 [Heptranchias perlo]|uniref:jupiter microtubule associated homolog 2 isoform X2 n=1 Tax=Heptranchias perlo TaxID=212740 RepID=UPI00355A50B5